jgi:hypothetical protein
MMDGWMSKEDPAQPNTKPLAPQNQTKHLTFGEVIFVDLL